MPFLASEGCFWPLTASITSEVKINYAYVITQGICNKFIKLNFCVGYMVCKHFIKSTEFDENLSQ
jgi:hypothetical protein